MCWIQCRSQMVYLNQRKTIQERNHPVQPTTQSFPQPQQSENDHTRRKQHASAVDASHQPRDQRPRARTTRHLRLEIKDEANVQQWGDNLSKNPRPGVENSCKTFLEGHVVGATCKFATKLIRLRASWSSFNCRHVCHIIHCLSTVTEWYVWIHNFIDIHADTANIARAPSYHNWMASNAHTMCLPRWFTTEVSTTSTIRFHTPSNLEIPDTDVKGRGLWHT